MDGLKCPSCQQDNRDGAAFCDQCGSVLAPKCPNCGAQLRPGARFCDACGVNVSGGVNVSSPSATETADAQTVETDPRSFTPTHLVQKILKERGRIAGERRNVTVLFVDAKGFTPLSEALDAEQVYTFIQGGYEHMLDAVHRYEGTVNQFTGDGIMALFGAPIAHEDSARRAVAAGIDMQRALKKYAEEAGVPVSFRVGINTGPVVVGEVGDDLRMEYTAIGDTTNLAARMEQMAEPGGVYLTESTYRPLTEYFDFEDLGLRDVKGKAEKVHVYKALAERDVRTRLDAAVARGLSPFCGREREVETLKGLWHEALGGRGQIVLISGEPGIGKSRLLLELRRTLGEDVIWREAHCVSYGENIPYLPVVELVRNGFGISDGDDEGTIIGKVDVDTSQWEPAAQKSVPYLKFLLQVDPGDAAVEQMDPMERRAGILDALRELVVERSRVAPRVIVVEDLHWADAQSEEAFRVCADVVASSPVLMILTFRPGYLHPSGDLPHAQRIVLGDLDADARYQLAEATLDAAELPETLVGPVTRKAEGNPLFIEEVSKALAAGATDTDSVPNSLQDVILSRIDRLEAGARQSLQLASVIGREFTMRLLDRISDLKTELAGVLTELKGLELIYEKTFFPELAYMFKHALTHDVAYSTLLVERRKVLHSIVAAAIEELYPDRVAEHYETLAHHYLQAENWKKALDYLEKAGDKASSSFAAQEAIAFFEQALDVAEQLGAGALPHAAAIAEKRGMTHFSIGALVEAGEDFDRIIEAGKKLGDHRMVAHGLVTRGAWSEAYNHEFETALETIESALELLTDEDDDIRFAAVACMRTTCFLYGNLEKGAELEPEVERLLPNATGMYKGWHALFDVGIHNWEGRYDEAIAASHAVKATAEQDLTMTLFIDWMEGLALGGAGRYDDAIEIVSRALRDAERIGDPFTVTRGNNTLGWVHSELYDLERATQFNLECLRIAAGHTFPDPEIEANAKLNLADLLIAQGKLDEAEDHLRWVERVVRNPTPPERWALWLYSQHFCHTYGELCLMRGDLERARQFADECLWRAEQTNRPKNAVKARRLRGQISIAHGDLDEAGLELESALDIARKIGNPPQLWKTLVSAGDLEGAHGREGRTRYREALGVIEGVASNLFEESMRETFVNSEHVRRIKESAETL